ncbi:MAG TPA: MlaD family protein [Candidatus Omnitrophota bacterium]|jgi:phospholipid/cholesterol/gamma-HCH transport system substrate-binding protein|nr:MlaD family protein [Candidatus Omnitrophota bacterium]HSA31713.1 MlaD family protein [Candidatus Omnitrophota bacterium]
MTINNETRIGIFVVVVAVILAVLTWKASDLDISRSGSYEIKVHFRNVDGVALNAPVTLNGLEVGRVSGIELLYGPETKVEVILRLNEEARLHHGARAFVKNLGLLGEKYVGLTSGDDTKPFLTAGELIQGDEPASFERLLSEGDKIAKNLEQITSEINERLKVNSQVIDNILLNMNDSLSNVKSISATVNERLNANGGRVDDMVINLNKASKNLEEMSYDLKLNPWKLLYKSPKKAQ